VLESVRDDLHSRHLAAAELTHAAPRPRSAFTLPAGVLAAAVAAAGLMWWITRSTKVQPISGTRFMHVTFDSGLTTDPALSPDGQMLAYASDGGGGIERSPGAEAIRSSL